MPKVLLRRCLVGLEVEALVSGMHSCRNRLRSSNMFFFSESDRGGGQCGAVPINKCCSFVFFVAAPCGGVLQVSRRDFD